MWVGRSDCQTVGGGAGWIRGGGGGGGVAGSRERRRCGVQVPVVTGRGWWW